MSLICDLIAYKNVLTQLVWQQLVLRYRRTALGYLWTLVNPLLMMSIMAAVFSNIYNVGLAEFSVFLFAGMIPWTLFNSIVSQGAASFVNNESLIKKIYLPKMIFPLSVALAMLVDAVLSFIALLVIVEIIGNGLGLAVLFLPLSFFLTFVFAFGIGLAAAVATVFFRDLQYIIAIALQGLFFLTPILYKNDSIQGRVRWLVDFNPVTPFVELFRSPLCENTIPNSGTIFHAVIVSIGALACGYYLYACNENKIVFRL